MRTRILVAAFALNLALAAPALARGNGEGLLGETDDRVVTLFSLGVLLFFVLFIVLASMAQAALDRRKQQRDAAKMRQRTGW